MQKVQFNINNMVKNILTRAFMPWLIVAVLAQFSCTEEITVLKDQTSEIKILNSLICANDVLNIYFGNTSNIFNSKNDFSFTPETVILFMNDSVSDTLKCIENLYYSSSDSIKPCDKLKIEAHYSDGDIIYAFDSVPESVEILTAEFVYPAFKSIYDTDFGKINLMFNDPPGLKNYYEILFLVDSNYIQTYKINNSFINIDFENDPNPPNSILFNDDFINGKMVNLEIYVDSYKPPMIILRNCSKSYYDYMNSLNTHFSTQNTSRDDMYDMFKGDPVELYSNIEGGLGIFASYAEFKKECVLIEQND